MMSNGGIFTWHGVLVLIEYTLINAKVHMLNCFVEALATGLLIHFHSVRLPEVADMSGLKGDHKGFWSHNLNELILILTLGVNTDGTSDFCMLKSNQATRMALNGLGREAQGNKPLTNANSFWRSVACKPLVNCLGNSLGLATSISSIWYCGSSWPM